MENKISSYKEFSRRLDIAIKAMKVHIQTDSDPAFLSILKQLEHVSLWTAGGARPKQEDINRLSFGMLASRALDDTDQPLAQEMYFLAEAMSYWPPERREWK